MYQITYLFEWKTSFSAVEDSFSNHKIFKVLLYVMLLIMCYITSVVTQKFLQITQMLTAYHLHVT